MSESAEPANTNCVEVEESEEQTHERRQRDEPVESEKCNEKVELICDQIIEDGKHVNESHEAEEQVQAVYEEDVQENEQDQEQIQELLLQKEEIEQQEIEEKNPLELTDEPMHLPMANTSNRAIEDEEMPSMVNISIPSKIDDSEANIKQDEGKRFIDLKENYINSNSKREEDNDSDSVCVIDDDDEDEEEEDEEEEEEGSYIETDGSSSYHDDDESIETAKHRYHDKYDRRHVRNEKIGEDDTTEEDVSDSTEEDDDGGIYGGDGGSDDLVLRHSTCLLKHDKERSASLQDLTLIKGPVTKHKPSVNPFSQKARLERNQVSAERRLSGKQYAHVESKVKKYIMDMNEQRRLSGERRKKAQEEERFRNQDNNEAPVRTNQEAVMTYKAIRDYTEKTLKEVAECEENEEVYDVHHGAENGEISIFPRHSMSNGESVDLEEMDVDQQDIELCKNDEKIDKINGTASNENQIDYIYERKGIIRRDDYSSKPVLNGEDSSNPVCDLRSLTYDEYMRGAANKEINSEDIEEVQDISEKSNNNDIEPPCILQIESITSNYRNEEKLGNSEFYDGKTPSMMVNQSTETFYQENHELNALKYQLNQRNVQFDNLRDAYQKTISENLAMKMELDNLKKMVAYYQEQQKPISETKVIAIQTEEIVNPAPSMPILEMDTNEQHVDPKMAGSMTSAMSSQWSESTISAAISMEPPPNITNALVSDDSQNQAKTPLKQKKAFSRAFLTSSKILQTLSSITYGKSKKDPKTISVETPEPIPLQTEPSNSKKRKATDTLEISRAAQPFKIPNIEKDRSEKNEESSSSSFVNPNIEKDADNTISEATENQEQVQGADDDVKVFVFPDDDNGIEHSFLIQAKEVTNNSKPGVRECGPYLLGNVEVYMTEMNGTINIWGKELSQVSTITSQTNEEFDTTTKSKDLRSNLRSQSTPRIFSNHSSASTGKKSKVLPRFLQRHPHQHPHQHSCEINNTLVECDHCNSHNHRLSWPSCNQSMHEKHNSCCSPNIRTKATHCGCLHRDERQNIGMACCKSQSYLNARGCSLPNVYQDNLHSPCCCNNHPNHFKNTTQDELHRHQTCVRQHSFNPSDDEDNESVEEENLQFSKSRQTLVDNSNHSCSNSNSIPTCSNNRKSVGGNSSHQSPCQNENDPLICQRQVPEAPEIRKRKSNGKRVRGMLLDLLKGCGDCRPTNPIDKTNPHQNISMYEPSTSVHCRPTCHVNQQSCSLPINEKCSECRHRNSKTAELEAQLEFFRIEMDKLRSRSDTLREMLDTIRNEDITN